MRSSVLSLILVAGALLFTLNPAVAADPSVDSVWQHNFAAAKAEAARLHRPLVVHFHASWCGPCRKMEKEVLHTPQILKLLDEGFVAVKVDLGNSANGKIQTQYRVEGMPTDLVLSHDGGKILYRSDGYTTGDLKKYLTGLNRVNAQYLAEGKRKSRDDAATEVATNSGARKSAGAPGDKLVPDPVEPRRLEEAPGEQITQSAPTERSKIAVAMDGYCPVTLRTTRTWKPGAKDIAHEHEGQLYHFLAAERRDEFKANPSRYAPRLMGCDPVVLAESDLAIRGSTKFGAYYDGELFLFETAESRTKFRKEPARYTRLKHVLKPEDIKDVRKVASADPAN